MGYHVVAFNPKSREVRTPGTMPRPEAERIAARLITSPKQYGQVHVQECKGAWCCDCHEYVAGIGAPRG